MRSFIVLDVETTQNQISKKEEIIDLSAVEITESFEKLKELDLLINPGIPLTYITQKVTGIKDLDVKGREKIESCLPVILDFISNKPIIAHNARFDQNALNYACEKCGQQSLNNHFIDSLKIAKRLFPSEKNSLSALKQRFGITEENHKAKEDVSSTIKVLIILSKLYEEKKSKKLMDDIFEFKI